MCSMAVDLLIVHHRYYHGTVPGLGRPLVIVVHMSDSCHTWN